MLHFLRTFSIKAWLRRKNYCEIKKVRNYQKILFIKSMLKLAGGGGRMQPQRIIQSSAVSFNAFQICFSSIIKKTLSAGTNAGLQRTDSPFQLITFSLQR